MRKIYAIFQSRFFFTLNVPFTFTGKAFGVLLEVLDSTDTYFGTAKIATIHDRYF